MSTAGKSATAALVLLLGAGGCVSLDPSGDVDEAAGLVEARTGERPAWRARWEAGLPAWDGAAPLSASAAVATALANNPEVGARLERIGAARAELVESGLLPNPVLNVALGLPLGGEEGGTFVSAGLMQQLTALLQRPARMRSADAALRAGVLELSDRALTLAAEVRMAHARIGAGEARLALARERRELLGQALALVRLQAEVGEA